MPGMPPEAGQNDTYILYYTTARPKCQVREIGQKPEKCKKMSEKLSQKTRHERLCRAEGKRNFTKNTFQRYGYRMLFPLIKFFILQIVNK